MSTAAFHYQNENCILYLEPLSCSPFLNSGNSFISVFVTLCWQTRVIVHWQSPKSLPCHDLVEEPNNLFRESASPRHNSCLNTVHHFLKLVYVSTPADCLQTDSDHVQSLCIVSSGPPVIQSPHLKAVLSLFSVQGSQVALNVVGCDRELVLILL